MKTSMFALIIGACFLAVPSDLARPLSGQEPVTISRYYSGRTVQIDPHHVGTVFMNRNGLFFIKLNLDLYATSRE